MFSVCKYGASFLESWVMDKADLMYVFMSYDILSTYRNILGSVKIYYHSATNHLTWHIVSEQ